MPTVPRPGDPQEEQEKGGLETFPGSPLPMCANRTSTALSAKSMGLASPGQVQLCLVPRIRDPKEDNQKAGLRQAPMHFFLWVEVGLVL